MQNKFISTITAGAIIGVAAGMMLIPNMDRNTRRRAKKTGKMVMNMAGDMYDNIKDHIL
ncbi:MULTISPECIES: YtxH domain-containing protein [Clostridium]|uniref:YtxH domain-containing protein n=2 Tax=Clostridium TaxID=1485 RepID=A0A5N7IS98_9CLOT|nr:MULTISPECIES: YtxH domain-containing protein [Clostridium]MBU3073272.1 YtxH domain-containing protein [Clostridium estertheticum]MBU3101752.1 YtxH domain-containing protein [Clostridium sp. DSM 17811]MBU3155395.1 YtxH domain-containing protein [Clostridium estertheticum]MBU3163487.1 YtxH domain-containing protein [Clostridium estertheticum]MBU3173224.1 YtxH domain-containing protein [Clostridium estertheticum]